MHRTKLGGLIGAAAVLATGAVGAVAVASGGSDSVASANPRIAGNAPVNVVASTYYETPVAHGTDRLENPTGPITRYGYLNDQLATASGGTGEATGTEPDGNTYLTMDNPGGPTAGYNYGKHFLFQSHETLNNNKIQPALQAYITRINLDVKDD